MRNVLVTGASRGLGLQIAATLAGAGYRVIGIARASTAELAAAANAAATVGTGAIEFRAQDLADLAAIPEWVRGLRSEFGTIYGLVNNAGMGTPGVLGVMPDPDIERLFLLNSISPIMLTKYVVRHMMLARSGRVINISSIVAANGYAGLSVYSATKAALIGFTRALAREVGPLNITVNAIAPGFIDTHMTEGLGENQRAVIVRRSALKRMAEPIDVARSVEYLLGEGGRNVTGTVLTLDAGGTV